MESITQELFDKAYQLACKTRLRAYAPYSNFLVGAVLVSKDGALYSGHNIENASFGGTVCAERVCFFHMLARDGKKEPWFLVLVTEPKAIPCGFCLQVMNEFCSPDFPIFLTDTHGAKEKLSLKQLLPYRFDPDFLPQK